MATNQPNMDTVFSITELVENILLHFDPFDLMRAQLVCRQWRELITTRRPLQTALFYDFAHPYPSEPVFNPLIRYLLPKIFPALGTTKPTSPIFMPEEVQAWRLGSDQKYHEAVFRPEASWRRMRPMNVPCRVRKVVSLTKDGDEDFHPPKNLMVYDKEAGQDPVLGATMELVWDVLLHKLGRWPTNGMAVEWRPVREETGEWDNAWKEGVTDEEKEELRAPWECSVVSATPRGAEGKCNWDKFVFSRLNPSVNMRSTADAYLGMKNQYALDRIDSMGWGPDVPPKFAHMGHWRWEDDDGNYIEWEMPPEALQRPQEEDEDSGTEWAWDEVREYFGNPKCLWIPTHRPWDDEDD
ncbi:hypothetical protein AbraIFM66951_003159 [Aspergillus brasiliensis]|uniref:F-box domain-containing protein n=1 Tax=Aspergillus brasiliensis TaxID=319629 RepID=A0A9W5Z2H5_9EURO|nr:hypothetical protein AbraCBS73388_002481 [Aspergillus brasiliensis]GKZ50168.1 hypothetical protein AbraIFM66951_003159 [Aspergillus brasiliensis]